MKSNAYVLLLLAYVWLLIQPDNGAHTHQTN